MSYIPPKEEHQYPWYVRLLFWSQKRNYGQVLEPGKLWGRSPRVFLGVATLFGALNRKRSPIDAVLRALLTVRISQINWCTFCVDINSATVLKRGGPEDKLNHMDQYHDSPHFTEAEKVALEYADTITYSDRQVTPELMERVRKHYDDDAVVELTGLIAFQNLSSKFNAALDIQPQGFCKIAPQPRKEEPTPDS